MSFNSKDWPSAVSVTCSRFKVTASVVRLTPAAGTVKARAQLQRVEQPDNVPLRLIGRVRHSLSPKLVQFLLDAAEPVEDLVENLVLGIRGRDLFRRTGILRGSGRDDQQRGSRGEQDGRQVNARDKSHGRQLRAGEHRKSLK
jgi:hypothetical protein